MYIEPWGIMRKTNEILSDMKVIQWNSVFDNKFEIFSRQKHKSAKIGTNFYPILFFKKIVLILSLGCYHIILMGTFDS